MNTPLSGSIHRQRFPNLLGGVLALAAVTLAILAAACAADPTPTPTPEPTATPAPTATPIPTAVPTLSAVPTPRPVSLPADEALHTDPLEWWYYSGTLEDENGNEYGYHFVIFQAMQPGANQMGYLSHVSILDVATGRREQAVQFGIGAQPQPASGFALAVGDWTLSGDNGSHSFTATTDSFAFDLTLNATKPPVLHREIGYFTGLNGWTYYYSWTDMDVSGQLVVDGEQLSVTGKTWMDHQWGDFVITGYPSGWQWFAVSTDNNYELMVAESRESDGEIITYATLVDPMGAVTHILAEDIEIEVLGTWKSPHTDGDYPAGWRISIPAQEIEMTLTPLIEDQEFTLAFPTQTIYWEGLVEMDITFAGESVGGSAYVELVGFARVAPGATPVP